MIKVKIIPVIHLRTTIKSPYGKDWISTKTFKTPDPAAHWWAVELARQWEEKKFAGDGATYHRMTDADFEEKYARIEKAKRRSLPIFTRMLGSN